MPAPTPTDNLYLHGKMGTLTVGGTTYYLTSFDYEQDADELDVTCSPNSTGRKQYQQGLLDTKFSGNGYLNLNATGGTPVTLFQPGSYVAIVWKPDGTTTMFSSSYAEVGNVKYTAATDKIITFSFSGHGGNDATVS